MLKHSWILSVEITFLSFPKVYEAAVFNALNLGSRVQILLLLAFGENFRKRLNKLFSMLKQS